MKNLTRKIMTTFFAGMTFLTMSCASGPKFQDPLGNYLFFYPLPNNHFALGYDTDDNGKEDYRKVYKILGKDSNGTTHAILIETARDENDNGIFDEEEIKKVKSNQVEEIDVQNADFSESA